MSEKTRCRGINFSSYEKELVTELVTKHRSIIECKKADGLKLKEKDAAWEKIRHEFNSSAHVSPRTTKQLRQFYVNLKRNTKKARCEGRIEHFNSGVGECKRIKVDEDVLSVIQVQADPLSNLDDSDALYYGEVPVEQEDAGEVLTIIHEDNDTEVKLEPMEDTILFLGEAVAQTSTPKAKPSTDKDSIAGASKMKQSSRVGKANAQSNTDELAARTTLCEQEMLLMQKKYRAELELIELKKETQKLKQQVLKAKLAKLK